MKYVMHVMRVMYVMFGMYVMRGCKHLPSGKGARVRFCIWMQQSSLRKGAKDAIASLDAIAAKDAILHPDAKLHPGPLS